MEIVLMRWGGRLSRGVALVLCFIAIQATAQTTQDEESPFVTVHLSHRIIVDIPRSWRMTTGMAKEVVEPIVSGDLDLSGLPLSDNNILLRAVATPTDQPATMSIAFLPKTTSASSQKQEVLSSELSAYDQALHHKVDNLCKSQGIALLEWSGTRKEQLNGTTAVVSEYRRQRQGNLPLWEQVTAIPVDEGLAVLMVSYSEHAGLPWRSVIIRIRSSFHIDDGQTSSHPSEP